MCVCVHASSSPLFNQDTMHGSMQLVHGEASIQNYVYTHFEIITKLCGSEGALSMRSLIPRALPASLKLLYMVRT